MDHELHEKHEKLLYAEEVYRIQGAVFEVSRELGSGFLESVYQECLAPEFAAKEIPFTASPLLSLRYKGRLLEQKYRPDFVCFDRIVIELKAVREFAQEHRAQLLNCLKPTGLRLGLLVNFGCAPKARVERLIL